MAAPFILDVNLRIKDILGVEQIKKQLSTATGAVGVGGGAAKGKGTSGFPMAGGGVVGIPSNVATQSANDLKKIETAAGKTNKKIKETGETMKATGQAAAGFGHSMQLALTRYSAFALATAAPLAVIAGFKNAAESVIEFDTAMTKMSQILDTSKAALGGVGQEMIQLSVDTGTSLSEITKAGTVLAQAGFLRGGTDEFKEFLEPLAKVPLLASFDGIEQATEGVIAAMNQFSKEGLTATDVLDKLDYVSNNFATTASDLVEGIKRGGGAFAALGGNLNEFIALFTTMRSVTRESDATIGTSIRTITARMARPRTIKFLEGLGVEVKDADGELLSLIQTLGNLNDVFQKSGKEGKAAIAEKLGGFRQISRVLAAIQNPEMIQKTLKASEEAAGSIERNSKKGLDSLGAQLNVLGARWTEFVQSMGEPIFIPLIKGATGFLNVIVSVVDAMGPLFPLFVKLVGFAAGMAALGKSIMLIPVALNLAAKAFAGAGGLLAAGSTGLGGLLSADTRRIGFAAGGAGAGTGLGAAAAVGVGASSNIKAMIGKQIPQLIAATGIYAAFGSLAESAQEAGREHAALALETGRTVAAMVLAASFLSGKSITQLAKGTAGYAAGGLGASALALGALGTAVLGAASFANVGRVEVNIDKLVKKAAAFIGEMDIQVADKASLNTAGADIGKKVSETVDGVTEMFDGVGGFFNEASFRMKSLSQSVLSIFGLGEADWGGIAGAIVDEDRVKEMFDKIYQDSPKQFRDMLDGAIEEAGPDFREALQKAFMEGMPEGTDPALAKIMRERLIENTGGERAALSKVINSQNLAAQKKMAEQSERLAKQLSEIVIPSQILTQLDKFGFAINALTTEINSGVNTFSALSSQVGQISAPTLPTNISDKAIQKQLSTGGFEQLLSSFGGGEGFGQLGEAADVFAKTQTFIDSLLKSLNATEAAAETQGFTGDVRQKASVAAEDALQIFFDSMGEVPAGAKEQVQQVLREVMGEWSSAIEDGLQPDEAKIKSIMGRVLQALDFPAEEVTPHIKNGVSTILGQIEAQMQAEAQRLQIIQQGTVVPEDMLANFNATLTGIGKSAVGTFGEIKDAAMSFGFKKGVISLVDNLGEAETNRTKALKSLHTALQTGEGDWEKSADAVANFTSDVNHLLFGLQEATKLINLAQQNLPEGTSVDDKQRLTDLSQFIQREGKLEQLDAVVTSADIYQNASNIFDNAVSRFDATIRDLSRVMSAKEVAGSLGAGLVEYDPETGAPRRPMSERPASEQQARDIQALGVPAPEALNIFNEILADQKTGRQKDIELRSKMLNAMDIIAGTITGRPAQLEDLRETGIKASPEQFQVAFADFAALIRERGDEFGDTGASLNAENLEKNIRLLIEKGDVNARSQYELTQQSNAQLIAIQTALEAGREKESGQVEGVSLGEVATEFSYGAETMTAAADSLKIAGDQMQAIMDVQNKANTAPDVAEGENQAVVNEKVATAIGELGTRMDTVKAAIDEQTQTQVALQEKRVVEPIEVDGLLDNTEALAASAEAVQHNQESMNGLNEGMTKVASAMEDGIGINIETMSKVAVDVKGVSEASKEFTKDFEVVATRVAKKEVHIALKKLANAAGSTELANNFESAMG